MFDAQVKHLAEKVLKDSCRLQAGERVLIESVDVPAEVIAVFMQKARDLGVHPFSLQKSERLMRETALSASPEDIQLQADLELEQLSRMQAHVLIRCPLNSCEMWDVPQEQLNIVLTNYVQRVHYEFRNRELRFLTLRWPSLSLAERAGMSTAEFEDFFFASSLVDYNKFAKDLEPLVQLMQKTNQVRIKGPGDTDLSFSIQDMPVSKDVGERNLPDGEISTAPIKESVNGRIHYNLPVIFYGQELRDIVLDFRQGRVRSMSCQNQKALERLLNQDPSARYVGEFALGVNPYINRPVKDILFDEKMNGTLHLAQGNSYGVWNNGNRSCVHLDFILSQTEEYGGGEVIYDGKVIRKDGWFVLDELQHLNLKP